MVRFGKESRLRTRTDFDRVRREGVRVATEALVVAVAAAPRKRVGIIVSGNVGNAVTRNRIKRVIREHFRLCRELYPLGDCVIIARPKAVKLDNKALREQLTKALKKSGTRSNCS